ncbi:prephenate dehydrogenase [Hydrogenivirga caldilitoris]|uniref:prephenate dehydrogenase n=1 Tax=Hydrogenivirga caldilitoris TaxID=246264 RepID=A0A497XNC7_9AQUI|nr:prephenate dehydrogenase/arogenate dehydrogenase family protein [Hydrogenivirga caldilitoris]RLJ70368.1 prephenate dehydrogenase [Hydrogenivirga caldilitoris]
MDKSLLIVGVGFMGGSFALALRRGGFQGSIYGIDINSVTIDRAKELGVIDEGGTELSLTKRFSPDYVIFSSPVRTFRQIAGEIKGYIRRETVVTDLGSVKGKLVFDLEGILGGRFVGSHPIAGTEKSGVEHSFPELFENKKVVITPTERTEKGALDEVVKLWELTGGKVEFMDPMLHDWVFGAVSHLPHAVAFALIDALIEMSNEVDLFKYPGGGFKDFTRIAASDPVMWRDIFLENKDNILRAIDMYSNSLQKLRNLIEREEESALTEYLREAKQRRMSLE